VTQSKTRNAAVDNRCPALRFSYNNIVADSGGGGGCGDVQLPYARYAAGLKNVGRRVGEWVSV